MSFIHPDASLISSGNAAIAAAPQVSNNKQFSELETQPRLLPLPLDDAHASCSPRDKVEIKIVMLKVQVIRSIQLR